MKEELTILFKKELVDLATKALPKPNQKEINKMYTNSLKEGLTMKTKGERAESPVPKPRVRPQTATVITSKASEAKKDKSKSRSKSKDPFGPVEEG